MNLKELQSQVIQGEDTHRQFKVDVRNAESLASEMAAFSNAKGGTIFIGICDNGAIKGLTIEDVGRINQLISNAASQMVRSPITVSTENVLVSEDKIVIVLSVPMGIDKPYFDKKGVIWTKCGSDKRRINSKEELKRLFQVSDQFHADELPTTAGIEKLDRFRFRDFLQREHNQDYPETDGELLRLLQNLNLATGEGQLNLAGVLLFAEFPERLKPQFIVKAICFPGDSIHTTDYLDTEDFFGPMRKIFDDAMGFIMRNLHKVQAGRGVNSPGVPEIPPAVFEELLVNALIHRDYMISASVRLFIYDNRIEMISPGHLPNHLTIEKIKTGNSNIRNPILASYAAKGMLPYHGLGSGIKRALHAWPEIEFLNDEDGCQFTVIIHRKQISGEDQLEESSPKTEGSSPKTEEKILMLVSNNEKISTEKIGELLGITKRAVLKQIEHLKKQGRLERVGPAKGGFWRVMPSKNKE